MPEKAGEVYRMKILLGETKNKPSETFCSLLNMLINNFGDLNTHLRLIVLQTLHKGGYKSEMDKPHHTYFRFITTPV